MTTVQSASATESGDPVVHLADPAGRRKASRRARRPRPHRESWRRTIRRDWQLYSLVVLPLAFFVVFRYVPMLGNAIAFRRFRPGSSIFGDEWVGLRYIQMFLNDQKFWEVFQNTVILGALTLVFIFPLPVILALLLNELRTRRFKRIVQSISYLPHFISIVIVVGMVMQIVSVNGTVNQIIGLFGGDAVNFIQQAGLVPHHLRLVRGVADRRLGDDPLPRGADHDRLDLYEAARIDGANRLAADLAHHAPGHPADHDHPADPEHRHVHGGRVREGPAALQPAHLPDRRRDLHVPVPGGHRLLELQLRDRDRAVRVLDRAHVDPVRQRDLAPHSGDEPVVALDPTKTVDRLHRTGPTVVKDTPGYRVFRVANAVFLVAS